LLPAIVEFLNTKFTLYCIEIAPSNALQSTAVYCVGDELRVDRLQNFPTFLKSALFLPYLL
jgi:hypothetical protein